ncbi:MAG: hypothetical protein AAF050_08015 [Cyanobacteria bacterium J06649_5]
MQTPIMLAWPDALVDSPLNSLAAIATQIQAIAATVIRHPVWAIALFVLGIGLLQVVVDLIKRLLKAGITLLLKLPFLLSQWIWKRATIAPGSQAEQVEQLLEQLETLRQQQDDIVAQLRTVLSGSLQQTAPLEADTDPQPASEKV